MVGEADVVVPQNLATAVNYDCLQCLTYALATQLVVTLDGPLSDESMAALEDALGADRGLRRGHHVRRRSTSSRSTLEGFQDQITRDHPGRPVGDPARAQQLLERVGHHLTRQQRRPADSTSTTAPRRPSSLAGTVGDADERAVHDARRTQRISHPDGDIWLREPSSTPTSPTNDPTDLQLVDEPDGDGLLDRAADVR